MITKSSGVISAVIMLLIITLLIALVPTEAEAGIYEDTVRLHILANSDSAEDQELKLILRDKLLLKYGGMLAGAGSTEDAVIEIENNLYNIERDLNLWLDELGYSYSAGADLTTEWYDTRVYESYTLPAGYYKSLIIKIENGEGRNWWCVMYPPLCLEIAEGEKNGYSDAENALISKSGYRVKFKILEAVSSILR